MLTGTSKLPAFSKFVTTKTIIVLTELSIIKYFNKIKLCFFLT